MGDDVTRILSDIESGDPAAAEQLLPLVYDELRKLARRKLRHEQPGQTLEATALVHEVNNRKAEAEMIASDAKKEWNDVSFHAKLDDALKGNVPVPWPPAP
jgi:hypothetical protein